MYPAISAIGIANPVYKIDQAKAAELVSETLNASATEKKLIKAMYRFTGIKNRYSVLSDACKMPGEFEFFPNDITAPFPSTSKRLAVYKKNALSLALTAVKDCLSNVSNFDVKTITHVITVSCTGMYAPGLDIELVQALGLSSNTKRTAINFMGCYGAFNGIKVAESICKAESNANVLVICVEICTIHFQRKTDIDNLTSNAIFADGASCALIQSVPSQHPHLKLNAFYCDILPQSSEEMAWHIGDFGFDMVLSSYVPEAIGNGIPIFLKKLAEKMPFSTSEAHSFAIHPGAKKILMACQSALNISQEQIKYSYNVLENYGNMSSATVLFVLNNILKDLSPKDSGKPIYSCAFGPGLTLESMLLQVDSC